MGFLTKSYFQVILLVLALGGVGFVFWNQVRNLETVSVSSLVSRGTSDEKTRIKLYFVALEDGGGSGDRIGCGDSAVAVEREIAKTATPLKAAMEELLAIKEKNFGQSGLYNALYQSELHLESAVISEDGEATIYLRGNLVLGGVCDNPRVDAQIRQTAMQFPSVEDVEVFLNDRPLSQVLSMQ